MDIDVIEIAAQKMGKTIEVFRRDLQGLRAGRANPQLLDRIMVDYYGTPTPINQLGNISAPEPRLLVISLWDSKMISEVEKAINKSDLHINPTNDGKVIRLMIPELTEERRRDLVKQVSKKGEEARIAIRSVRRDANDQLRRMKKDGELTEDDLKAAEEKMQKKTDSFIKEVDVVIADKEKEIMSV